jgi:hypothetical protein
VVASGIYDKNEGKDQENIKERRRRVDQENAELSAQLSSMIKKFLSSSKGLQDKQKFPTRRLAKIVLDSIVAFEWTHSEIFEFASRQSALGNGDEASFVSNLATLLNLKFQRRRDKSKAAILVDCMWDESFLHGEVQSCMIERVRCYVRNNVFSPWKIVKAMDLAGFNLSLAGIEVLRKVDSLILL